MNAHAQIKQCLESFGRPVHYTDVIAQLRDVNPATVASGLAELARKHQINRTARGYYAAAGSDAPPPAEREDWQNEAVPYAQRVVAYLRSRGKSPKSYIIAAIGGNVRAVVDEMVRAGDIHYTGAPGSQVALGPHPHKPAAMAARHRWNQGMITDRTPKDNPAAQAQAAPQEGGEAVLELVLQDLRDRSAVGTVKYGTELKTHNGRDALLDAYQEACDLVMYLRQAIAERDAPPAA